jgi:glycosyltransferase involved in cell wall biosynthesis
MKILIPVYNFGRQGGYRVLSQLANHWIESGHQVDFLTTHSSNDPYFPTIAKILYSSLSKNSTDKIKRAKSPLVNKVKNLIELYLGIKRSVDEYDIVLATHSLTTFPIYFSFPKIAKKVYYIQAYEPEYYSLENSFKGKVLMRLSNLSYKLSFLQIANAPIYLSYKNIKAKQWIPPGLDLKLFTPKTTSKSSGFYTKQSPIVIGCIGRSEPSKGFKYVLEAFDKLSQLDDRYVLHIAYGNFPFAWSNSKAKVVIPKNDQELSKFYAEVDILLAPGTVQLGAVHYPVIEAMATKTCVVTTGYLPATTKNSWIVDTENSDAIVQAIVNIDRSDYNIIEAKTTQGLLDVSIFSWDVVSKDFLRAFENLLKDNAND